MRDRITRLKMLITLTTAVAILLLVFASVAAAKPGPDVHNALRGPGAVVHQQPQTRYSKGFDWSSAVGAGVFLVVMGLALGYSLTSTRDTTRRANCAPESTQIQQS